MIRVFDKPITIEKQDPDTEEWTHFAKLHAYINPKRSGNEVSNAGAERATVTMTFEIPYTEKFEDLRFLTQLYRIVYRDKLFNITAADLYEDNVRNNLKLTGELYGG